MNIKNLVMIDKDTISKWIIEAICESVKKYPVSCYFRISDKTSKEEDAISLGMNDKDNNKIYYTFMATTVCKNPDTNEIYVGGIVSYVNDYYEYYCRHYRPNKMKLMRFLLEAIHYRKIKNKMKKMMRRSFRHEYRHVQQFNYILSHGLDIYKFIEEGKVTKYEDLALEKDAKAFSDGRVIPIESFFASMELKRYTRN